MRLWGWVAQFFGYIQDFMWFKLALVCEEPPAAVAAAVTAGAVPYRAADLQGYLNQYPSKHYSRDGAEPLMYVTVLLLSLQFKVSI